MKIAIVGSRTFNDYEKMCSFIDEHLDDYEFDSIEAVVSGGAKGAESRVLKECGHHGKNLLHLLFQNEEEYENNRRIQRKDFH